MSRRLARDLRPGDLLLASNPSVAWNDVFVESRPEPIDGGYVRFDAEDAEGTRVSIRLRADEPVEIRKMVLWSDGLLREPGEAPDES